MLQLPILMSLPTQLLLYRRCAHSDCPFWLSIINLELAVNQAAREIKGHIIFQFNMELAVYQAAREIKGHRVWYVATKGLSVYCLQKGTITISDNSLS